MALEPQAHELAEPAMGGAKPRGCRSRATCGRVKHSSMLEQKRFAKLEVASCSSKLAEELGRGWAPLPLRKAEARGTPLAAAAGSPKKQAPAAQQHPLPSKEHRLLP